MHKLCVVSSPIPKQNLLAHVELYKAASADPKAVMDGLVMPMCSLYL